MMKSQPAPLRAVVFDLDGLMFNTEELYIDCGNQLLGRRGHMFADELRHKMMGRPAHVALQIMIEHHGLVDTVPVLLAESDVILERLIEQRLAPMPGLLDLLAALEKAGLPKAIATSSRRTFVDQVLKPFELESRFSFILTSDDITHGKPHPEIYQKAAERLGLPAPAVLVLEDSQNGCKSALAAGAYTVAVPGSHNAGQHYDGVAFEAESLADKRIYTALGI